MIIFIENINKPRVTEMHQIDDVFPGVVSAIGFHVVAMAPETITVPRRGPPGRNQAEMKEIQSTWMQPEGSLVMR